MHCGGSEEVIGLLEVEELWSHHNRRREVEVRVQVVLAHQARRFAEMGEVQGAVCRW